MLWRSANAVVEELRKDTRLYLPALTKRRGFSTSRVEHLLNRLVQTMPKEECYLEVGTLEGRSLEAASVGNDGKTLVGVDPCDKYDRVPEPFPPNVEFVQTTWQDYLSYGEHPGRFGCVFYDGDHSAEQTCSFMHQVQLSLANEAILVLDDWDRESVREGAFLAAERHPRWRLLREMPEYGNGLTVPQSHFGYSFGISVWGWRK